jgi:MmyB-like transcription regulator ligand binding domain
VDNRREVRDFLVSRRAKITPEQVGLAAGGNRRVSGLRHGTPTRRPSRHAGPWPSLQWALDAITGGPAFVRNGRMDIVAANALARAFYNDLYADPRHRANLARFTFLDPAAERFYPDWALAADICVAILRTEAGRDPTDKDLHDLVGELSTRSDGFRTRWGAHDVRHHGTGTKRFRHAVVGDLELSYEGLELVAEPGLTLTIFTAEPGSPSHDALRLLASWAASEAMEQRDPQGQRTQHR